MKINFLFGVIIAFNLLLSSCNKNEYLTPSDSPSLTTNNSQKSNSDENRIISGSDFILPAIKTKPVTNITSLGATSGGIISNLRNRYLMSAYGICWSTNLNPTIANSKTVNGPLSTYYISFNNNLTGLIPNTVYHVRAYATYVTGTYYGNDVSFTSGSGLPVCGPVTDIDGNIYNVVTIGTQCWMKENLKTTRYKDGTLIPTGLSNVEWQTTTNGAYAIYNNDVANNAVYGKLYNGYAVQTGKLAPAGWHVPTEAEWTTLVTYLGGVSIAGNKMKSTTLWQPFDGIVNTNSSGFTGYPGGFRYASGEYYYLGYYGNFWTSSDYFSGGTLFRFLSYENSTINANTGNGKENGFSVRCIKD